MNLANALFFYRLSDAGHFEMPLMVLDAYESEVSMAKFFQ